MSKFPDPTGLLRQIYNGFLNLRLTILYKILLESELYV
jgi:hypothetical protein